MNKLIKKGLFFILILLILLVIINSIIDRGLRKTRFSNWSEWNDIFNSKINADFVILGSSRAWVHFSPYIIDSTLKINSYNLGLDGFPFEMQYLRILTYLRFNTKPKQIIISLDLTTFTKVVDLYMYEQFYPYLNDTLIRNYIRNYNGLNFFQIYFPSFKYFGSSNFDIVKIGLLEYFGIKKYDNGRYKGYKGQESTWDNKFEEFKKNNKQGTIIYSANIAILEFDHFLEFCHSKNIDVVLVYSPEYKEAQKLVKNREELFSIFRKFSFVYNLPFLDYSNDSICLDSLNFYNSQHLNAKGSVKFSKKLAQDLKNIIKNN